MTHAAYLYREYHQGKKVISLENTFFMFLLASSLCTVFVLV